MSRLIRDLSGGSAEMLEIFSDAALVKHALAFEAALAEAEAAEGLLTADEAARIAIACAQLPLDTETLALEVKHAGTLAIPLVHHLRRSLGDDALAAKIHRGATSQDVADTGLMLQAKAGAAVIARELARLQAALALLAERMAAVPMAGRTLLQNALPITFGLKAVQWLAAIDDAAARLAWEAGQASLLQFGGAAGTRAGLDGKGAAIAAYMAKKLGLASPLLPWHARRGHIAGLASVLAIVTGASAKIARDISLLAQNEIGEAFEPRTEGRGGSSAMAHKRNPAGCQIILSAAARAPGLAATIIAALPQEQERGLGGWQAEAPVLADLFIVTHGAVAALAPMIEGLEVDGARMAENLKAANIGSDIGESEALVRAALKARS
ncbi:MAG TPA: 3-carboxy-cis,cis-muconate cycloisomerase [Rhizomicrobium sp.]|jgi:3-carboxy-cis,cis-muconate cycloisomerase|nr:3-carboxy-cis,cis-muconate cycloisomerase [Rhizomicrobium sp.]